MFALAVAALIFFVFLLVDTYFFQVGIHGVFVYGFGAHYEVQLVRSPSWFFGLSENVQEILVLFECHFIFSF